jgi:signal peptidase I
MKKRKIYTEVAIIATWGAVILACLFGVRLLLDAVVISTGSMRYTLLPGDHLIIDKLAYAPSGALSKTSSPHEEPKFGDIIMFRCPIDTSQIFIKRVVGVPGDRLKIIERVLYRDGNRVIEPYTHQTSPDDPSRDNFPGNTPPFAQVPQRGLQYDMLHNHVIDGEIVIPSNGYFVMGDNRDNSYDSRYWGFVPRDYIIGKPVLVYWSQHRDRLFHVFRSVCGSQLVNERSCFVQ